MSEGANHRQGEGRSRDGRAYRAPGITVYFDARKCIHSGVCVRGLPQVFDVGRRPWVRADLAAPAEVAALIDRCPSGALGYDWSEEEQPLAEDAIPTG